MHASINGKEILKGINLTVNPGEIHALMGQNGAGKSTLSNVLVGNPAYEVTSGSVTFNGKDLLAMKPEERAHEGLFLSFQQPVEIPGVSMVNFMRAAINAKRKYHGMEPMSAGDFLKMMREKRKVVEQYEVLGMARHSETEEEMVVYRALYGERGLWVRPAAMWCETVERDGKVQPRFVRIEE